MPQQRLISAHAFTKNEEKDISLALAQRAHQRTKHRQNVNEIILQTSSIVDLNFITHYAYNLDILWTCWKITDLETTHCAPSTYCTGMGTGTVVVRIVCTNRFDVRVTCIAEISFEAIIHPNVASIDWVKEEFGLCGLFFVQKHKWLKQLRTLRIFFFYLPLSLFLYH